MAKPSINLMSEIDFLETIGPPLESIEEDLSAGVSSIEKTFPKLNSGNYEAMMEKNVSIPYPWFIWLAAAARFVIQRHQLLHTKEGGNG